MLPLGVSAVTLGFGFLITLDEPPLDLRDSPLLVPIAQALVALPLVVRTLVPVLAGVDDRQRQAAASLGASPLRASLTVDLPVVWRPLLAAAGFAFAVSLGEFGATSFLARDEHPTLPVVIFRLIGHPGAMNYGMALAASVVLAATTACVMLRSSGCACPVGSVLMLSLRDVVGVLRRRAGRGRRRPRAARRAGARRARARRAAASPRCCARSPGSSRSPPGRVRWDGADLAGVPTHKRGFALMFQDGQLFAHLTVARNVGYALRLRRAPGHRGPGRRSCSSWSAWRGTATGCPPPSPAASASGSRWPGRWPPSRGCCCSTSRSRPSTPACASGSPTDLRDILRAAGTTALMVTHDHEEAFTVADRMAVMRAGRVVQEGPIAEVWREPADPETALFLGYARVFRDAAAAAILRGRGPTAGARGRRTPLRPDRGPRRRR